MLIWIYILIFGLSVVYAVMLNWWQKNDPIGFFEKIWFQAVVGIGYVILLPLLFVIPSEEWLKILLAFVVACPPVIARSLWLNGKNNNRFSDYKRRCDE